MAKVTSGQRSNIKVVICESYKPDTTFKDNEGYGGNPAFSSMPVECTLMEIRRTLWETTFITEYQWFRSHFMGGVEYRTIAELTGTSKGKVENRVDDMLDDAVYRMPEWLATKCLGIYTVFFRENQVDPPKQRGKRGVYKRGIDVLLKVC